MKEKPDLYQMRDKEYCFFIKDDGPCGMPKACYEIEDEDEDDEEAARFSAKHYYDKLASIFPRRKP